DFESQTLRDAIAAAYGLAAENILVGNGSNELLAAAIGTFVGPGTQVVIPRPTFTLYDKLVTVAGGSVTHVAIDPRTGLLPLEKMLVDNAVIIVCSPNNPTGGVLPQGGLQKLLDTGSTVLFDRAYGDFAVCHPERSEGSRSDGASAASSAGDSSPSSRLGMTPLHDRLVTFSTFSKAWGLAGLRVGWLASTAATAREIRKVKLPYSLNIISEAAAALALKNRAIRDANVKRIIAERERLFGEMKKLVEVFPTQANFITFRTKRPLFEDLCARGILVRDVSSYPGLAGCLRVSVGSPEENDRFLAALKESA
ncbi:MAG TPA: aminotransferase class I/II-fold pyridoxal phosphate-dependent enzyme, partial [Thermoanaerobaculia bacterium]|nr:aminotransferase class I/II-fold pyridoxal phosphate-dependent enzyme [Thermoanaerobaculia bacterium]